MGVDFLPVEKIKVVTCREGDGVLPVPKHAGMNFPVGARSSKTFPFARRFLSAIAEGSQSVGNFYEGVFAGVKVFRIPGAESEAMVQA